MSLNSEIFEQAYQYNFDAIRDYCNNGKSINICDSNGDSLLAVFLEGYIRYADKADKAKIVPQHDECDYEFWDSYLSESQKTPLRERDGGTILEQLNWFLANGADINLCDLSKTGSIDTPLSVAVGYEDFYLTEYLLGHGADPKIWLVSGENYENYDYERWLMEHMDVMLMDAKGERVDNLIRIATILAKYGIDDFGGFCISVDSETRTIERHGLRWKF